MAWEALLGLAFVAYAGAGGVALRNLLSDRPPRAGLVRGLGWSGLGLHLLGLVAQVAAGRLLFGGVFETMGVTAWLLVAAYLLVDWRWGFPSLGAFVFPLVLALLLGALVGPQGPVERVRSLNGLWLGIHVSLVLLGYVSFLLAFCYALVYLAQNRLLKAKRLTTLSRHLPSVQTADETAYRLVALGFPVFTLGLLIGVVWASLTRGQYFGGDAKEAWSWLTWAVFAAYLHMRLATGWKGRRSAMLLLVGFACVVITYLVVGVLPIPGWHRFA